MAVFLVSVGSQLINVDKIVGAFLAGLAVNDVLGSGPVKEKVEFVGGVLFISLFSLYAWGAFARYSGLFASSDDKSRVYSRSGQRF